MEPITAIVLSAALIGGLPSSNRQNSKKEKNSDPTFVTLDSQLEYSLNPVNTYVGFSSPSIPTHIPITERIASKAKSEATIFVEKNQSTRTSTTTIPQFINNTFSELYSYLSLEDGWDGEDSVKPAVSDVRRAIGFVASLPSYMPIPTPMISPSGEIGLYWDIGSHYADINFDFDGSISMYSRSRNTVPPQEKFQDGLLQHELTQAWYFSELGCFVKPFIAVV